MPTGNRYINYIIFTILLFVFISCQQETIPKCNHDITKETVMKKAFIHSMYNYYNNENKTSMTLQDFEARLFSRESPYSFRYYDNSLLITKSDHKSKEDPSISIKLTKISDISNNEVSDGSSCVCSAMLNVIQRNAGLIISNDLYHIDYSSKIDSDNRHIVTIDKLKSDEEKQDYAEKLEQKRKEITEILSKREDPITQLNSPNESDRLYAAMTLSTLQSLTPDALPHLEKALRDKNPLVVKYVSLAISKYGSTAIPILVKAVNNKGMDSVSQSVIADVLRGIGIEAVPALINMLSEDDIFTRIRVRALIGDMGTETIPMLTEALSNNNENIRNEAAYILGEFGEDAEEAIPYLVNVFKENYSTQIHVALEKFGIKSVPYLLTALEDDEDRVRINSAILIAKFGVDAKIAVPYLKFNLTHNNENVRLSSAIALVDIDPAESRIAIPILKEAITKKHPASKNAEAALERLYSYPNI